MIRKALLAVILLLLSGPAANATVLCAISATDVAFGEVTRTGLTSVGAIVLTCTGSGQSAYVLTLTTGIANTYSPRSMVSGTDKLAYNLYSETTLTSIWGNGSGASTVVTGTIKMGSSRLVIVSLPVYGRVESQAEPAAGNYLDGIDAGLVYSGPTTHAQFQVTAQVTKHCAISATNLSFSDYTQAQLDGQSQIQLTCTDATPWDVGLDGGRFPGALTSHRSMAGPALSQLDYQLFSDPARTTVWGDRVGNDTVSGTGTGLPQTLNVYGRIPSGQNVRDGGYVDTITATVTF